MLTVFRSVSKRDVFVLRSLLTDHAYFLRWFSTVLPLLTYQNVPTYLLIPGQICLQNASSSL